MAKPKALIVRAPGTNCDIETAYAFELAGAQAVRVHVNQLIEKPTLADSFQILCFPGGFSYGDDIAAGRIAAVQWQTKLADVLSVFQTQDRLVLGICNGFQIMMRLGIFFDADEETRWLRASIICGCCYRFLVCHCCTSCVGCLGKTAGVLSHLFCGQTRHNRYSPTA
jgi:phosphoribosylformylglycinamidine (FGAM) synthase-like amidotransferase family enzyme